MRKREGTRVMPISILGRGRGNVLTTLASALFLMSLDLHAQTPELPSPNPPASPASDPSNDDPLLERLRRMEAMNQRLLNQVEKLSEQNQALSKKYDELSKKLEKPAADSAGTASSASGSKPAVPTWEKSAPGPDSPEKDSSRLLGKISMKSGYDYKSGFGFDSDDGELQFKLRGEVQVDSRIYQQGNQDPVNSGFYVPRTRFYFAGRVTKPIDYQLSLQRGYSGVDLLNAYLNFNYDPRFQVRFGRFKAPYLYEYYKLNNWQLLAPERSLYSLNFGLNRMIGLMGWGELLQNRMEYAVGIFDGPRNSYQDFNGAKDVIAFLNFKPFENTDSFLQNLNFGGSADFGDQNNPLRPVDLRTSANASTADITSSNPVNNAAVPFLQFNPAAREKGARALWDLHLAYYYKGFSFLASWNSGFESFTLPGSGSRPIRLPIGGYYVQAGYILTGETLTERTVINPLHPFDLRPGKFGLGAFEITSRFSQLSLGQQVFTQGLSDPNLWTNTASMVDVGLNWYLNQLVKVYFDWEHAMFGNPVYFRPGPGLQKTSDLFWIRCQIYF